MDLQFSDADLEFQQTVRNFVEENLPTDIRDKVKGGLALGKDDYVRWQTIL
ncbi:MAG: pimeloyl-CoA dehydrogenase large subunit, partial [Desulfuromonadales bacterium]|nr:pimeloyl-CoA dehydrogenase large subunit [Desulfuromonadales bacterium]NIS44221.1 pimeloyl-CoA dehydrogenase large subunit [Desulfuromonadales bacterium]